MVVERIDSQDTMAARSVDRGPPDREKDRAFDFCNVLAAGLRRPADGMKDRYTYDPPVIQGHALANATIVSREALYRYLGPGPGA